MEQIIFPASLPQIEIQRNALILYTSGTTNKPKGVVTTHINIEAQISTLIDAWEWSSNDRITCVLPLHHVHGIINVVGCSLWSGATCYFTAGFSPKLIFNLSVTIVILHITEPFHFQMLPFLVDGVIELFSH